MIAIAITYSSAIASYGGGKQEFLPAEYVKEKNILGLISGTNRRFCAFKRVFRLF